MTLALRGGAGWGVGRTGVGSGAWSATGGALVASFLEESAKSGRENSQQQIKKIKIFPSHNVVLNT